jgi:hypothetical protein
LEADIQSYLKMKGANRDAIKRRIETQVEEEKEGGKQREKEL